MDQGRCFSVRLFIRITFQATANNVQVIGSFAVSADAPSSLVIRGYLVVFHQNLFDLVYLLFRRGLVITIISSYLPRYSLRY